MRRTVLQFLDDIVDSIDRIERYTKGVTFEEFPKENHADGCSHPQLRGYR